MAVTDRHSLVLLAGQQAQPWVPYNVNLEIIDDLLPLASEIDAWDQVILDLATHAALTTAHGAVSAATANRIPIRDGSGRFQVATPSASADVATKGYVDGLITGANAYQGTWNANTNTPTLASGVGTAGHRYTVSTAGTTNLDGVNSWAVKDWVVFNGTTWEKVDNTEQVDSVNGQVGVVVLTAADVGAGNVSGTGVATRIAIWSGTNDIDDDSKLLFDAGVLDMPDGVGARISRYDGSTGPYITGRRARGSLAVPAAVQQGDILMQMAGTGWDGSVMSSGSKAAVKLAADETWNGSAQGARVTMDVTAIGATTAFSLARWSGAGMVMDGAGLANGDNCASALLLDLRSTTKGVALPRMTTTQRNAMTPIAGTMIYNTTLNWVEVYNGTYWTDTAGLIPLEYAISDETTDLTTGTAKLTVRAPFAFSIVGLPRLTLSTASSSGVVQVDINEAGSTIFSTELTVDATETTSATAATPAVVSDAAIADQAILTFDVVAAGTGARGGKVLFMVRRT